MRDLRGRVDRLERRDAPATCDGSPVLFLVEGVDFPAGDPPEHPHCPRCGERHEVFDGVGRRIALHVDPPETKR
jgi:hypothetical protein